uniref:Uncharacterized protein LOC114339010 n=1 Tax=Diabrotica virgifera virgifera TaxID=50390 RepID=A0A6P7GNR9_DIAVI
MDHLAQDLSIALEETESCGSLNIINVGKWGMRRRTRSAGNLHLYTNKAGENRSDDSSSSNSEIRSEKHRSKLVSFHQSDSDDMTFSMTVDKTFNQRTLRMRHPMYNFLKGKKLKKDTCNVCDHLESKIKHCVDNDKLLILRKEKDLQLESTNSMEIQSYDENCEIASESSISWSGGEGHEGDDELTDWAPSMESSSAMEPPFNDSDPREIRAGCRRLREERPGFSINTSANERVSKFLQDTSKSELRLYGAERDKLGQLAALYSLELWVESPNSTLLRKTNRTPSMQPTQRHHSGLSAVHKKIRTQSHHMIS